MPITGSIEAWLCFMFMFLVMGIINYMSNYDDEEDARKYYERKKAGKPTLCDRWVSGTVSEPWMPIDILLADPKVQKEIKNVQDAFKKAGL